MSGLLCKCFSLNQASCDTLSGDYIYNQQIPPEDGDRIQSLKRRFKVGFINPIGVVAGVWRQRLALSIGPNWVGST
jgi:hypothetical protein